MDSISTGCMLTQRSRRTFDGKPKNIFSIKYNPVSKSVNTFVFLYSNQGGPAPEILSDVILLVENWSVLI